MVVVRVSDLQRAEGELDEALEALRSFSRAPEQWSAHERVDDDDRKVLVLHKAHFDRLEALQRNVEFASQRLRSLQATFAGGGL